jgi:hypothetical protein
LEAESFPWIKDAPPEELTHTKDKPAAKPTRTVNNALIPLPNAGNQFSLRTTRPSWAVKLKATGSGSGGGLLDGSGSGAGGNAGQTEAEDLRKNGPRVFVFVLGGLTFSEIRSAYDVSKESQREVLLGKLRIYIFSLLIGQGIIFLLLYFKGSTSVNNPTQFLNMLRELHKSEGYTSGTSVASVSSLTNLAGIHSNATSPHGSVNSVAPAPIPHPEAVKDDKKVGLKGLFKKK